VDTFLFNTQTLYIESLLDPGVIELWSRCQVILLLMAFSLTAMLMPRRHHKTRALLGQYKHKLDYVMNTNMNDLYTKNTIFYTVHRLFNKLKSSIIY
ncbi:MAG: hypothetical protein KAT90_14165, partial [Gammaproteobacteria bacterium]|nr:hypothetical protein [Gammaproteobacteria bacterium]